MADGYIPDKQFNDQLRRLVAKDQGRPQFTGQSTSRWQPRGSGGGGGGGASSCMTANIFSRVTGSFGDYHWSAPTTLQVVSATTGQKPGPIRWYFEGVADSSAPGGSVNSDMYKRNRNNGYVQWTPTEIPILAYNEGSTAIFAKQIDSEVKVYTAAGSDVTSADLISAWVVVRNTTYYGTMGYAELAVIIEVTTPDSAYSVLHTVYEMPGARALTQGRPADFSYTTWYVFGETQYSEYTRTQDVIYSDEKLCVLPLGTSTSGTASAVDIAAPDLFVTYAQAFTGTANPNEYDNVITIQAYNNSDENMTVQYDEDLLYLNLGQTAQLSASSTFAVTAGSNNSKVINTTVTAASGIDVLSIITGSVTATGDTTGKAYEAYSYNARLVE